jgi:hypothetical protein
MGVYIYFTESVGNDARLRQGMTVKC